MNHIWGGIIIASLLVPFIESNPLIYYSFCIPDHKNCKPTNFGANSTLIFENDQHNVYIYKKTPKPQLSISCSASEPLRWTFSEELGLEIQPLVSNVTVNKKFKTYYYEVLITEVEIGIVRCENMNNPSQAAEIYVDAGDEKSNYPHPQSKIKSSIYYNFTDRHNTSGVLVPCFLRLDHFKPQEVVLKQIRKYQLTSDTLTDDCVNCVSKTFTATNICQEHRCGPLRMKKEMWEAARYSYHNQTNETWKDCLSDLACSKKVYNMSKNSIPRLDCNGDLWITCFDQYLAIKSFPKDCQNSSAYDIEKNFKEIESCLLNVEERTVNYTKYDPRFGFLIPSTANETVYKCPPVVDMSSPVILSMNPLGVKYKIHHHMIAAAFCANEIYSELSVLDLKIKAKMTFSRTNSTEPIKGLSCQLEDFTKLERLQLHVMSCQNVFDCQTKLETTGLESHFRRSANATLAKGISEDHSKSLFGKFIKDPVKQGAALCFGFFSHGFVREFNFFVTGLDAKFYFLNDLRAPEGAFLQLSSDTRNVSIGKNITFQCTIASFILFPLFHFTFKFSNGTTRETTQDLQMASIDSKPSMSVNMPVVISANLASIECAAPRRDSSQWASHSLHVQDDTYSDTTRSKTENKADETDENINNENTEDKIDSVEPAGGNNVTTPDVIDNEDDEFGGPIGEFNSTTVNFPFNSPMDLALFITPMLVVLLLIAFVLGVVFCRRFKVSQNLRELTDDELDSFIYGQASESVLIQNNGENFNVASLDFPSRFCIEPSDVKTNANDVLWEGEYSQFVTGKYQNRKVAISVTKSLIDVDSFKDFLLQVKTTVHVQGHINVLDCIGAVVSELKHRKFLAIFELSSYGDLISYLQCNALRESEFENYNVNVAETYTRIIWKSNAKHHTLKKTHLYHFCEQIAAGMEYLGSKKVVHGKLAARNVMVFPALVVKITDFGLSRDLYKASNYSKGPNTPLPWRWMAMESLKYMEFSSVTDVWSYGVTTWEIFSMGRIPYSEIEFSSRFANQLGGGLRLTKPEHATDEIYEFMSRTWNQTPSRRPCFDAARQFFGGLQQLTRDTIVL